MVPSDGDHVIFGSTTPTQSCYWDLPAIELGSMTITGTYTGTLVLNADIHVSSTVNMNIGAGTGLDLNGRIFHVKGDWVVGDIRTTSTVAGSAVRFYGGGQSKIWRTTAGPARFNGLIVDKDVDPTVGVRAVSDLDVAGDFTVSQSSFVALAKRLSLGGDVTLTAGFFDGETSTVDLRAVAYDLGGTPDPSPAAVTVQVYPADPDSSESLVSGRIRKQMKMSNGASAEIRGSDTGQSAARITLPAGALSSSSATATLIVGAALPAPPPDGASDAGLILDISLSNGQTALLGTASLEFYYPDADGDGVVDGTGVLASDLKLFTYSAAAGAWVLEGTTVVDAANKRIIGTTPHFSVFAAFPQATAVSLDRVRVYPVPFIPYGPNPDEGRPFVSGDLNTGIIFDNLPAACTIRIYTLTGGLVAEFSSSAGTGRLQWDARNDDGRMAASGGYLAVITSPGQKRVVKRLSIIR